MPPRSLFRSTSFRLVAWYAAVFGASVAILLAFVYWITLATVDQQIYDSVEREMTVLVEIYTNRGLESTERAIQRRLSDLKSPRRYLLLQDASGRRLGGNLPAMTPLEGWSVMEVPPGASTQPASGEELTALGQRLKNGEFLLVGENRYRAERAQDAIVLAFGWGIVVTVLLALAGGALLTRGFLRRIEEINRTSRAIMAGNLADRVPTRGCGDEMDRLAVNLNAMLDRIQALMESLKRVSDDIAHDLRTPLSRLRQRLETARTTIATPQDCGAAMDQSLAEVDAILETFSAVLRIAQIEAGTRRASFSSVDLDAIVASVGETYAPVAEDHGQLLRATTAHPGSVCGDRDLITQMVANLVENSIRHCAAGTVIAVTLTHEADVPIVCVSDTGPGIPAAEREKVFRRFYRLETSRTTPGNGLGLALVKAIADLHNAAVELTDNHPGLRVSIRFRAMRDASHAPRGFLPETNRELLRSPR